MLNRFFCLVLFFIVGVNLFPQNDTWRVVEIEDAFGDKTGEKRLVYQTAGTFTNSVTTNSKLSVLLLVDNPRRVDIVVFEYGSYRVELDKGLFTYKINNSLIENVQIEGGWDHSSMRRNGTSPRDESTSLLHLLKQGGVIKFSVYQNSSKYRFDVNADNFIKLLSEIFVNTDTFSIFYFEVPDKNNKLLEIEFELKFKWSIENENLLKNNESIQKAVSDFFQDKDKNYALDRPGGYYQRDKVEQDWGMPLLENIRQIFPDLNLEYSSFRAW
jgi:hypothetical protein